jgi:phage tail sheath protein FI
MPEYLAPGVYVEEIPSGNKPIAAASTSTAAVVGLTERGPINTPTLCTSLGSYNRQFGGNLNPLVFMNNQDALPYAAEGFFNNGGSRLYVTRIIGDNASESGLQMVALDTSSAARPVIFAQAMAGDGTLMLSSSTDLNTGDELLITDGANSETITVDVTTTDQRIAIDAGIANAYLSAGANTITLQTTTAIAGALAAAAAASDTTLTLDDVTGLTAGDILLISEGARSELVDIDTIDGTELTVTLADPLNNAYTVAAGLFSLADSATTLILNADAAASGARVILDLDDPADVAIGNVLRMNNGTDEELVLITAMPEIVTLDAAITANHAPGVALVPAVAVLRVHARYPGIWGDALRVTAYPAMQVQTASVGIAPPASNQITLGSAFGLFPGSVIAIGDPDTTDTDTSAVIATAEVESVDTTAGIVTLTDVIGTEIPNGTPVSSQEFTLLVERIEDDKAVESETFDRLSMASEHPRYALNILGSWDTAADRPSESGGSQLIRLSDDANATTRVLPLISGLGQRLDGGTDDLGSIDDDTYIGDAADDPDARTGIQAMENEATLSIVAVPGQTSVNVQKALLAHCEKMRYRFAVLDTPLASTLNQAREHRQNFDNTRAAIYYPGLVIADPFGESGDTRTIHPSGHMMGVYARTDTTRGVHKAPANEVVRSILSFETALTKGEQDIANPINLNCFRDFRTENRGLRVYGGRVATSDPEWRYINVRRLLLFIEQSLDTGLQWAVFEPNDTPLWDTVKQSVTNFLNTVWRSGALEGTKQEEAFFVRIGYDITMTQDDIDNGRMIVEIGVAPVKPAEFVIVRISQKTREATG